MAFPTVIQAALEKYDREKGPWRQLFGDAPAIRALRQLPSFDQSTIRSHFKCFIGNLPKRHQASWKV